MTQSSDPNTVAPRDPENDPPAIDPVLFGNPDRYLIIGEHGRGGLGLVSRAHDRGLGRDVAIKELLAHGHVREVRFLREALITARLEHPGIVPIYEAGRRPDGTLFYAMKLVSGRSLRELLAERRTIDERIGLLHHVIAVADAIAYAHDRNIIHRDLKPGNVIVGDFGETIVIDWGLAKDLTVPEDPAIAGGVVHGTPDDGLTAAGSVLGTPSYMAPEQHRGPNVDRRADVFAIGVMLWELCSLEKAPPSDVRRRHRMLRRAGIDDDLIAIIDKASDPDPARRYPHAGALAADLKAFKSGARITARSYSLYAMLAHWTRRHRTLALSAMTFAALLIASVAALAVLYRASSRNAETAQRRLIQSYEEHGRRLLLDGEYERALPYLAEAYAQGDRHTGVRFMLARAERLASSQLAVHTHGDRARGAAFRPDGSNVLSLSEHGEAAIWNPETGQVVASLPARPGGPYFGAVSRSGAFVAIAHPDGVTIWDGVRSRTLATGPVKRLAIDASETRIAVTAGTEVSAWSVATGERIWSISVPVASLRPAWSGDAVVVTGVDTTARITDGHSVVQLAATSPVFAAFAGPGGGIATVSENLVELWDTSGARLRKLELRDSASHVTFSSDARRIAIGTSVGTLLLYDAATGASLGEMAAHRGSMSSVAFSDDGTRLATAGEDLTVRIWDAESHELVASLRGARDRFVSTEARFDRTGTRLVTASLDGSIRVFATTDPDIEASIVSGSEAQFAQFLDGGRRFAATTRHEVRLWSTAGATELSRFDLAEDSAAMLSPDATKLAIVKRRSHDASRPVGAEIRDAASQAVLARLPISGPQQYRWASFDHAGTRVVTGSSTGVVELWSLGGERLAVFRGHEAAATMATFSPDDRWIISAGEDRTARVWDIAAERELGKITISSIVESAQFDASGTRFVTASSDRSVRLWDARTFVLLRSFEHASQAWFATLSPDGNLLATVALDGAVSVWEVATSSMLSEFHQTADFGDAAFSPDGTLLLTTSVDHVTLRRFGLETRPPSVVAAFVRCRVPYRLVETRLEPTAPLCND